jgi:hypothetical protein
MTRCLASLSQTAPLEVEGVPPPLLLRRAERAAGARLCAPRSARKPDLINRTLALGCHVELVVVIVLISKTPLPPWLLAKDMCCTLLTLCIRPHLPRSEWVALTSVAGSSWVPERLSRSSGGSTRAGRILGQDAELITLGIGERDPAAAIRPPVIGQV